MRKSPTRHKVRAHKREGNVVQSFNRGSGSRNRPSRTVGAIPIEVKSTHDIFEKIGKINKGDYWGSCGIGAVALAYQINGDVIFGKFLNDEMAPGHLMRFARGEDHVWVEKNGMIYDSTAEQFDGVTGPVVTLKTDKRYTPYNKDTAEGIGFDTGIEPPLRWDRSKIKSLVNTKAGNEILDYQGITPSRVKRLVGKR